MSEPAGQPPPPDETGPLSPGARVGDYEIRHLLGKGGMGWVYAAEHPLIGKRAAVKVLQPGLATSVSAVARFLAEARAANKVGHPGIIDIFAFGELPDRSPYFVMEYLEGESLRDRLRRGPLAAAEAREVLSQLLDALGAAHRAGVVHRDLKPDNIFLVSGQGRTLRVKLLDFGIAKLTEGGVSSGVTQTGVPIGSPAYMSPEQCLGQAIDLRSDLYSTGVLLFEIFTGQVPFHAQSYMEMLVAQVNQPPPPPRQLAAVPEDLERVILWCLEKRPEGRPADVAALQAYLLPCLDRLAAAGSARPPVSAPGATPGIGTGPTGAYAPPQDPYAATVAATPGPGTPYPGTPQPGTPYPGTPQPGTPYPGTPQPPYPGTPQPSTPYPGTPQPGTPYPGTAPPPGVTKPSSNVWIILLVVGILAAGVIALAVGLSKDDDSKPSSSTATDRGAAPGAPAVNARILANWSKDRFWYPATVAARGEGARVRVRFDDGDTEWLDADRTVPLAFRVGERVQAKGALGLYVWANVMRVETDRLLLQDGNGVQAWVPVAKVRTPREPAGLPVMGIPVD